MLTKKLPHDALYPIAPHGIAAFSRYRKPKAPLAGPRAIICHKENEMPRKIPLPGIVTNEKIRPPQKAACTGKRERAFSLHGVNHSGRKALTSLGAPAPQHSLPAGGTHARAKTMTSLAFDFTGLIRSFHCSLRCYRQALSCMPTRAFSL